MTLDERIAREIGRLVLLVLELQMKLEEAGKKLEQLNQEKELGK